MRNNTVIIIRQANGVGIDKFLNGYDMTDFKLLKRKVYNGYTYTSGFVFHKTCV